jgi:hypothetical protein
MKRTPLKRRTKEEVKARAAAKAVRKPKPKKEPVPSVAVLDRLFSLYVRKVGECAMWGYGGISCTSTFDCSHIKSRRFHSVRWCPLNALCLCDRHHRWVHDHPDQNGLALVELLGREHLDELQGLYLTGRKPTPDEKRAIAKWLREELKK